MIGLLNSRSDNKLSYNNLAGELVKNKSFKPITIEEIVIFMITNSNWTEWSTIEGVIERVISKSDECEARGRFEITSTITPFILQAKKFLKCDWLRPVVFLPNLKYLHVKISVSMET